MHRSRSMIAEELSACIRCNECLAACPALSEPLTIEALNNETLDGPLSPAVTRYARACYLCGACVPVCPVGLHRDAMMLWLKVRLLRSDAAANSSPRPTPYSTPSPKPAHLAAMPSRSSAFSAPAAARPPAAHRRHANSQEGA